MTTETQIPNTPVANAWTCAGTSQLHVWTYLGKKGHMYRCDRCAGIAEKSWLKKETDSA